MKFKAQVMLVLCGTIFWVSAALAQTSPEVECSKNNGASEHVLPSAGDTATIAELTRQVRLASFPELAQVKINLQTFNSQSDYFRTRFSVPRFLFLMPMRYSLQVNPSLFAQQAPMDGVCAILAHELSHVVSLSRGNRIRRFGLVGLLSTGYTTNFERRTDLEAIHLGYGDGLTNYRKWVYAHIPQNKVAEKQRRYFSPEEIAAIEQKLHDHPELLAYWRKHVPLNLQQIQQGDQGHR